ncbi:MULTISPECIES: hypothetical protein [unclassified Janthinobacterium]|uniref:hypothetical protein n=1 Tax=unclassified Janthinobacterium TaxID=2610881 RepID=UPI00161D5421|nr:MULTISPECIES: hypothetical protein [unclassified Janthinobacterium]MBB5610392.1 hypothetical protein [Janthinobacterium sp. S3T4]MBB5615771.1 hypothetical protein [Janthinobacterium sp. S3M3]
MTKIFGLLLALSLTIPALAADGLPILQPDEVIAKYGKPDSVRSSEYEKPRPPLVTKMLEYKKEHVRVTLLAGGKVGNPPPYKSWHLIGYQDPRDNSVITKEEAEKRLLGRLKK